MFKEIETKRVLIFGCGNVLLGDDGFGPAVIERLERRGDLPGDAHAEDVGTSIRGILFDIALKDRRPEHIIVLDAVVSSRYLEHPFVNYVSGDLSRFRGISRSRGNTEIWTGSSLKHDLDGLAEMVELPTHPWFLACQFHPEFTSNPRDGHPLFTGFIEAARAHAQGQLPEAARA